MDFLNIQNPGICSPIPDDWHAVVSDVRKSTAAISKREYKEVNLLGASTIMAMMSLTKSFSR